MSKRLLNIFLSLGLVFLVGYGIVLLGKISDTASDAHQTEATAPLENSAPPVQVLPEKTEEAVSNPETPVPSVSMHNAEEKSVKLNESGSILFCSVPAGEFEMGSPEGEAGSEPTEYPRHTVAFPQAFWMSKCEVTQAQWQALMGANPSAVAGADHPVTNVSWNDCQAFLAKLNALGQGAFRLPAEAEWEYACRAGTATRYYWGDDPEYTQAAEYAWYQGNSEKNTHPVGQKKPNAWGLCDTSGNVWEWTASVYKPYGESAAGTSAEEKYVIRGGGFDNGASGARSAIRVPHVPTMQGTSLGLRLVWEPLQ